MKSGLFLIVFLVVVFRSATADESYDRCHYTIQIQTGSRDNAGTDAKVSLTIGGTHDRSFQISNLKYWGVKGSEYDYFERGHLDTFMGKGPCLTQPLCSIILTSDGSGNYPGWFVDYVKISSTTNELRKASNSVSTFNINHWLAVDESPYTLSIIHDQCNTINNGAPAKQGKH